MQSERKLGLKKIDDGYTSLIQKMKSYMRITRTINIQEPNGRISKGNWLYVREIK